MSKEIKLTRVEPETGDEGMTPKKIIAQLKSMKDNASSCLCGDDDFDVEWQADIRTCDAVVEILTALYGEAIYTPEQVHDLAANYKRLHQRFEVGGKPKADCGEHFCPECHLHNYPKSNYCWNCGTRLNWG